MFRGGYRRLGFNPQPHGLNMDSDQEPQTEIFSIHTPARLSVLILKSPSFAACRLPHASRKSLAPNHGVCRRNIPAQVVSGD